MIQAVGEMAGRQHAEVAGEGDGDRGDGAGLDDQEQGPAVEESPERAVGFAEIDVLAAGAGHHGRQFAVAQGGADGESAGDEPGRQQPAGGPDLARDVGGDDEDARADHGAGDEHGGIQQAEAAEEVLFCGGGLGSWLVHTARTQPAPAEAVEEIQDQSYRHPDEEANPGHPRQLEHQVAAAGDGAQRHPRHERRAKWPWPVGVGAAQDNDSGGHQHKGEEGADVGQFDQLVDVGDRGTDGDEDAGEDGGDVRRAVARMHFGRPRRQQAVARHGEEDARLAGLIGHQRRGRGDNGAQGDDARRPVHSERGERLGQRLGVAERVPFGHAGEHDRHGDVEHGADPPGWPMMPIGMSRCGLRVSSAAVETASNPM